MRRAVQAFLVISMTTAVLTLIAYGSGQTGTVSDCSSCHFGSRPEGDYTFSAPTMTIAVPSNISAGSTFQVLVVLQEREDYELIGPEATLEIDGLEGASTDEGKVLMERSGTVWRALLRVSAADDTEGSIRVTSHYLVHYDHQGDDEPDLCAMETSAVSRVVVGRGSPPEAVDESGNGAEADETSLGAGSMLGGVVVVTGLILWKRRRATAERRP